MRERPSLWTRLRELLCGRGSRSAVPRAPAPAPAPASLQRELAEVKAGIQALSEELRQLRQMAEQAPRRSIQIDRVEHMTVEQLLHVIGRLEVDHLDGTLNVGFSRNLRVNPKVPPLPSPAARQPGRPPGPPPRQ